MHDIDVCGRSSIWTKAGRGTTGKRQGVAILTVVFLASAAVVSATEPSHAQVSLNPSIPNGDIQVVCSAGASLLVTVNEGDCSTGLSGIDFFPTTGITIGPNGSQTFFDANNGNATFGAPATFNSSATFNNTTQFNALATFGGISAGAATFSGTVTMNGGLTVGSGQTVNMGGNRVQNVGAPIDGTDATNKNYVDGLHNAQQTQIDGVVVVNNQQNTRLTNIETINTQQDTRLTALEAGFASQAEQIAAINQSIKGLSKRDRELADGIAISLAVAQPVFQVGQRFAMRVGWGNFDGSSALGVSAAGLLATFNNGNTMVLDVGFGGGTRQNVYGGRAGLTFGW